MRSAVHKTTYTGVAVILSQGWRIRMVVATGGSNVDCALKSPLLAVFKQVKIFLSARVC